MSEYMRSRVIAQLDEGDLLEQIDRELCLVPGMSEEEHAWLWLLAWAEQERGSRARDWPCLPGDRAVGSRPWRPGRSPTGDPITAALERARAETAMDVAVIDEVRNGREVVRFLAGDAQSFGLKIGTSTPIEDTYSDRLLDGRLSNIVHDAGHDELVRDLKFTRDARVGAYVGLPLTALDCRVYVLCCLAHEQRPSLCQHDLLFVRGLSETIIAALDAAPTR
jgi:GAF domain-containing protein